MSNRKWGIFSSLAYFYNAFACLADGKLVKEEKTKIIEVLLGWTNQEENDLKAVAGFVVQSEIWLKEDIDGSTDKKDLVNDSLNECIEIVKKELTKDQFKGVLIDLVEIGMADGNYDESEKGWVKMLADKLGIEPPKIQAPSNENSDVKEEDTGYAGITIRKFKDEAKQKSVYKYLGRWQDKTKTYNGKIGITGIIPEYFEDIDKACPKWSFDELDSIIKHSKDKKVIPSLQYIPDDFFTMTKQVWWLVPLVIWRGDIASWLFIDKNGFNAPYPDNEDGALIFPWDKISSIDFEEIEHNLFRMTLYQRDSDGFLTFDEFVPNGAGSYLRMIDNIYNLNQATIEASRGAPMWFHGVGGEGMKSFESPSDLLSKEKWEDANYPDPCLFGYNDPEIKKEEDRINKIIDKHSDDWSEEEINQIIKHRNYGKGSKNGDHLIIKIVSSSNIGNSWLEDFALTGLHPVEVVKHIVKNPKTDEYILDNLYQRESTKEWTEVDRLVLEHSNCPESLKDDGDLNINEFISKANESLGLPPIIQEISGDSSLENIKKILNEDPSQINAIDSREGMEGYTALHYACWDGKTEIAKYLIDHGANIHLKGTKDNATALLLCGNNLGQFECVKMLVNAGVSLEERLTEDGQNPYHPNYPTVLRIAVLNQVWKTVDFLIKKGASLAILNEPCEKHMHGTTDFFENCRQAGPKYFPDTHDENQINEIEKYFKESFKDDNLPNRGESLEPVSRGEIKKSKAKKKLTLQEQLADELSKLYPTADVKKVDEGNYLDIHMPDIHPKRGTHIWFNTPKAGGIKIGFFCRDKDFTEDALKRNSATIETYSNGLRLLGHPTFKKVDDAIKVADNFVKMLMK